MKFHANTHETLIKTGASDGYDLKWGRFLPSQRFNVDQSPLPFAIERNTRRLDLKERVITTKFG